MKPRILLNASSLDRKKGGYNVQLSAAYTDAVARAGGIPFIVPPVEDAASLDALLDVADAAILVGGGDISPERLGVPPSPHADLLHPRREAFDFALLEAALRRGLPLLGICLGCQIMAVHTGGTLYQHLPEEMPHSRVRHRKPSDPIGARHAVSVVPGSLLARIVGVESMEVNSRHHQGIRDAGHGMLVSARSADGLIEAIEDPSRPFILGVQWHPEDLAEREPLHRALFEALVMQAAKNRKTN
jgi:putative glutamine amidotransferase